METLYERVAGMDVHKKKVAVCVRVVEGIGKAREEVRVFGTMTRELLQLRDWLAEKKVTHVAMESTGVYWKPIYNILEGEFEVWLVNAQHVKNVPGRKTDIKDCEWLGQLLQCGLLKASFIPARPQREWRDLTRARSTLVQEKTAVSNRIQKVLEDANIKLASVASDVLGVSGRAMVEAMVAGESNPQALAQMARAKLRLKIPQLEQSLEGRLTDHHRFLLRSLLDHLAHLEGQIARFEGRIEELNQPFAQAVEVVTEVPGFNQRSASAVISEIGVDMGRFPSGRHISSWTALSPGNRESAGKHKSGKTCKGNRWLRSILVQAAWAASRTKDSYFQALYRRLAGRRGKKRAIVAVAHALLRVIYHLLKTGQRYRELGADYFDAYDTEKIARHHIKRLEALGYTVTKRVA